MKKIIILLTIIGLSSIDTVNAQENFIGEIKLVGYNFAERGWAKCEGQLLSIASNTALFSLIGTTYGGDGRTTFGLPDLRGRTAVGVGRGPGLSDIRWGERFGSEFTTLALANLPSHNHQAFGVSTDGTSATPTGNLPAGTKRLDPEYGLGGLTPMSGSMIGRTGASSSYSNMQPYLGTHYVIALTGIFPSRS